MNKEIVKWNDLYNQWKYATMKFPELNEKNYYRKISISKPQYGQVYYYNWVSKDDEDNAIKKDVEILASGWPEVGTSWSKGTLRTAALLANCETEEEFAAVWLCAFALSISQRKFDGSITNRNVRNIEQETYAVFAQKYGCWHSQSREFFPVTYIPYELFWDCKDISVSALVELAVMNAALVLGHYTPVEYKKE